MPQGMTKRRPKTVARLLDAALDVFAERGFYGASIEDICERAGLTRGAFYSNFSSKEELFFRLFDRHADQVVDYWSAVFEEVKDRDDPLEALYDHVGQLNEQDQRWFIVSTEFSMYAIRNPETANVLAAHDKRLRDQIVLILREAFQATNREPAVDVNLLARMTIAINEGGMLQTLVEPAELPFGTLERTFLPLLLRAASQENGKATRSAGQDSKR